MVAAVLLLGWLTANGCMSLVTREADQEREQVEQQMRAGIAGVAQQTVLAPVERELSEFARFRAELAVARAAASIRRAAGPRAAAGEARRGPGPRRRRLEPAAGKQFASEVTVMM